MIIGLTLNHINTQRVGIAFTVRGEFELDDNISATSVEYSDESSTATAAAATVTAGEAVYSFVHPGYAEPGQHTLTVSAAGVSAKSNLFVVVPS